LLKVWSSWLRGLQFSLSLWLTPQAGAGFGPFCHGQHVTNALAAPQRLWAGSGCKAGPSLGFLLWWLACWDMSWTMRGIFQHQHAQGSRRLPISLSPGDRLPRHSNVVSPTVFHAHALRAKWGSRNLSGKELGLYFDAPQWIVSNPALLKLFLARRSEGSFIPSKLLQAPLQVCCLAAIDPPAADSVAVSSGLPSLPTLEWKILVGLGFHPWKNGSCRLGLMPQRSPTRQPSRMALTSTPLCETVGFTWWLPGRRALSFSFAGVCSVDGVGKWARMDVSHQLQTRQALPVVKRKAMT
jgi:hypothetical protein